MASPGTSLQVRSSVAAGQTDAPAAGGRAGEGLSTARRAPCAVIYVYQITNNSNAKVGYIEGLQGLCQAAIAFPAGWAADYFGRDRVLKLCSLLTVRETTVPQTSECSCGNADML